MDKLQRSVAKSLEGLISSEIFPYLPYIFQDFWGNWELILSQKHK